MQRRGTENEKEIASKLLSRLSKKYNIDISKFDTEFRKFSISLSGWRLSLIIQICAVVCGVDNFNIIKEKYGRKHQIECSERNWLESISMYKILEKDFVRQQKLFYQAFIMKNGLSISQNQEKSQKMSEEQVDELKQIKRLQDGIKRSQFHKQSKYEQEHLRIHYEK